MSNSNSLANSEESSWTFYLQDFFGGSESSLGDYSWGHDDMGHGGSSTSSVISDAASVAAWQIAKHKEMWLGPKSSSWKKLSLKKRIRTRGGNLEDDDLEDTASSPVNSPKISEMKQLEEINPSKKVVHSFIAHVEQKISTAGGECSQLHGNTDRTEKGYGGEAGSGYNELRKRGLCVVPLSIFANAI